MEMAVILLEDDHLVRHALKISLEESGYAVIDGPTVEVVSDKLNRKTALSPFHLCAVVADYRLDHSQVETDGIDAIHRLEKVCGNGWRPVLITGDSAPDIADYARSAGVTLLRKPFGFDDLLAAIDPDQCVVGASDTIGERVERHFDLHARIRSLKIVHSDNRTESDRKTKVAQFSSMFNCVPTRVELRKSTLCKWHKRRIQLEEMVRRRTAELVATIRELEALCMTDCLTGLANRRHFDQIVEVEWRRAIRQAQPIAIIMMDVDRFKQINDQCGHLVGDDCLRRIASVLADHAKRGGDFVARYGGDEFVIILPNVDHGYASAWAEKVRQEITEQAIASELLGRDIVTVSFGVASMIPKTSEEIAELIAAADSALYKAKDWGSNQVIALHPPNDFPNQSSFLRAGR